MDDSSIVMLVVWGLIGFVCGSVPFSVLIAGLKGVDPRREGSKNPGATNVTRLCGLPWGIAALVCDALKGFLPVLACVHFSGGFAPSLTALCAVLGHVNSPFLGFKGGKGVATTIGVLLAISPVGLLAGVAICVAVIALTGYVSAGSLALVASLPCIYAVSGRFDLLPLALILLVIVFYTHRGNIGRLLRGEEKSWRKGGGKTKG